MLLNITVKLFLIMLILISQSVLAFDKCSIYFVTSSLSIHASKVSERLKNLDNFSERPEILDRLKYDLNMSSANSNIRSSVFDIYYLMNSKDSFSRYVKRLYLITANRLKKSSNEEERKKFSNLDINIEDLALTILLREQKNGKQVYILESRDKDNFRLMLQSGPFIDLVLIKSNHGAYSHLIQRGFVKNTLKKNKISEEEFYEFLGTKPGIRLWNHLFDSTSGNNFSSPEYLNLTLLNILKQPI